MPLKLTIATRGSKLALWQAEHVSARLRDNHPGLEVELLILKTQGDKILDVPLAKVGGKGLFVKEIEEALLDGRADLAVHSMKDVPADQPDGLIMGSTPRREDPADMMLSREFAALADLPPGAVVGTSSLRRRAQLKALRPDLNIENLRGNLDTRVGKLLAGEFAAIVVAAAGLARLGLGAPHMARLGPPDFLPAVGQGALGLQCRASDRQVQDLISCLDDPDTRQAVSGERAFLARLEGGCQVPIAAFAQVDGAGIHLSGLVADPDGALVIRREVKGPRSMAAQLGHDLAGQVLVGGGAAILSAVYGRSLGE